MNSDPENNNSFNKNMIHRAAESHFSTRETRGLNIMFRDAIRGGSCEFGAKIEKTALLMLV